MRQALHPVLVHVHRWDVTICVLAVTDAGIAIDPKNQYRPLGTVKKSARKGENFFTVTVWEWRDERGRYGVGTNKHDAIKLMLETNGFYEATLNATIPDLLSGLDETP